MISGIVLAAGLSQRMEGPAPKQLLPLAGEPLVAVTTAQALASSLDRLIVVTGHRGAEIATAVAATGAVTVANPDYRRGNMTSFRVAYEALPACDAYLILLADMPEVTAATIDRMVAVWRTQRPWAAMASYTDGRGHPLLLSADAMAEAVTQTGPKAVWNLLESAPEGTVVVTEFHRPAPIDVNTTADYRALVARFTAESAE